MLMSTNELPAAKLSLAVAGECNRKIFGISPVERLRRQVEKMPPQPASRKLVADAGVVIGDSTLAWLAAHPDHVILSPDGLSAAVIVDEVRELDPADLGDAGSLQRQGLAVVRDGELPLLFSPKLRNRQPPLLRSARRQPIHDLEWSLFKDSYKGVTDVITRWIWPVPAFWVVRALSRLHVTPNMVTICAIMLTILTGILFAQGQFAAGLAAGWLMTFLDTVDGKLARVTCTWSRLGNKLDHLPDLIHPPIWWACLAYGLQQGADASGPLFVSASVILATYLLGRVVEGGFKKRHGFNQYLWRPFDTFLRFIIARRNTILLLLTLGAISGRLEASFHLVAAWSVITIGLQTMRIFQAEVHIRRAAPISSWMM